MSRNSSRTSPALLRRAQSRALAANDRKAAALTAFRRNRSFWRELLKAPLAAYRLSRCVLFDGAFYKSQTGRSGGRYRLALDFLLRGAGRGVDPHPLFDTDYYLARNADVVEAGVNPLLHYLATGEGENRSPHPLVDPRRLPREPVSGKKLATYLASDAKHEQGPHPLFDPAYYLRNHEGAATTEHPLVDYVTEGFREGRSPHPAFDESIYRERYGDVVDENECCLVHYLRIGQSLGFAARPGLNAIADEAFGASRWRSRGSAVDRHTILAVAHAAGDRQFGGERSFLDVLAAIDARRFRLLVALPDPHASYLDKVKPLCEAVYVYRASPWRADAGPQDDVIDAFTEIIEREGVDLVYVNTILVHEPAIAARDLGVKSVMHIRELVGEDTAIAAEIGASAEGIKKEIRSLADYRIVNSIATREDFGDPDACVIYNAVEATNAPRPAEFTVGMISSNLAKKGLSDFAALAGLCPGVRFLAFGPQTPDAQALTRSLAEEGRDGAVQFPGYVESPSAAIAQLDVVVVLSRFAESFGRSAAEALAAGRPVVAYRKGALGQVVGEGGLEVVGGLLVEEGDVEAVAAAINALRSDPSLYARAAFKSVERAQALFSDTRLRTSLNEFFIDALATTVPTGGGKVSVIIPNYNYSRYLPERLRSILSQTRKPDEIIFLDDNSTDDSIAIAAEILGGDNVEYTILSNEKNLGVFRQWTKGLQLAKGDWIWIAEADDSCEEEFLERMLSRARANVNLVYAQSTIIDESGDVVAAQNRRHTDEIDPLRWLEDYRVSGVREGVEAFAFRNVAPNASACLFRKNAAEACLGWLERFRYVGDWALWAEIIADGEVSFVAEPLNKFRRHERSVTRKSSRGRDYLEELAQARLRLARLFPLTRNDVPLIDEFFNRDYVIDGVSENAFEETIAAVISEANNLCEQRRRWCFITTNDASYTGGSEVLWREAAERLRDAGDDVIVFSPRWRPAPDFHKRLKAKGVKIVTSMDALEGQFAGSRCDLVVVSTGGEDQGGEWFERLEAGETPFVIVNQLVRSEGLAAVDRAKWKKVKRGYQAAQGAFFASRNNLELMERRLGFTLKNAYVHFNPFHIDADQVFPWPDMSKGVNIAIPSKVHFTHKGQDVLLDVAAHEKWRARKVTFNFYGEGPDEEELLARAREKALESFVFHGRVNDIGDIWRDNHALLMPSRMEGLPIMLVSAMLAARTPIHTSVGGAVDVLEQGKTGFLAAEPTADAVDQALEAAWARRDDWPDIGLSARKAILDYLPEDPVGDFVDKLREIEKAVDPQ